MTHALTLPVLAADGDRVPFHADPVLAAIEAHSEAWAVFQAASGGEPALRAEDASDAALMALLGTACATHAGMFCLIRHLRWFLTEEARNAEGHGDAWAIALAREADLSRCLGVERVERLPLALPSGRLVGPVLDLRPIPVAPKAISAASGDVPVLVHANRVLSQAGDALAALVLIVGGCGLVGFASLF